MNEVENFFKEVKSDIKGQGEDQEVKRLSNEWLKATLKHKHTYMYTWLGRPVIQFPADIVAIQEIIWKTKPDLIVETGIAHGGSLILHASILELLGGDGRVLGIDVDIRQHNRVEIEAHPMFKRIELYQGSSIDPATLEKVKSAAKGKSKIMIILDSNHTHEHVAKELEMYSPLVSKDCYLVVFDTVVEDLPDEAFANRPWGHGDNPKTAVHEFIKKTDRFVIDTEMDNKLLLSAAPEGYLKCLK